MSEIWANPANWTTVQWMAVIIMAFVIVAILVMVQRLLAIVQMSKKQAYKPNLRRLRKTNPLSATTPKNDSGNQE